MQNFTRLLHNFLNRMGIG